MKRIIILFVLVFSAVGVVSAQNKNLEKLIKKETKLTVKKLQREGYELLSIGALEYEVYNYFSNLHTYGYQQALGFSTSKFIPNLQPLALSDALSTYAVMQGQVMIQRDLVKGGDGSTLETLTTEIEMVLFDKLRAALQHGFSIYRRNEDGVFECVSYFLVNTEMADKICENIIATVKVDTEKVE
jgi:hypothetical protein